MCVREDGVGLEVACSWGNGWREGKGLDGGNCCVAISFDKMKIISLLLQSVLLQLLLGGLTSYRKGIAFSFCPEDSIAVPAHC